MKVFLGIDTSAYTTSAALVGEDRRIIQDLRKMVIVPSGQRGVRQSEAFFQHIKNLPGLLEEILQNIQAEQLDLTAAAVSAWPRRTEGSYMPVFTAGLSHARTLCAGLHIPLVQVSHQEGHILAGLYHHLSLMSHDQFIAVHFSGGTSEILSVRRVNSRYAAGDILFQGQDIHAGQLVDRVGVAMGLPFPAGKHLEEKALKSGTEHAPVIKSVLKNRFFSFSGAETRALQLIEQGAAQEDIAFAVFRTIANTLEKCLIMASDTLQVSDILLTGGVMANHLIKDRLRYRLEHPSRGLKLYFAEPGLSTDNAVGVALSAVN